MFKRLAAIAALALSCGLIAGCLAGTTLRSREQYVATHHPMTQEVRAAILAGTLVMGMTEEEVVASIGQPNDINRSTYAHGTTAQFCYDEIGFNFNFNRYRYVYFENYKVTSWDQ